MNLRLVSVCCALSAGCGLGRELVDRQPLPEGGVKIVPVVCDRTPPCQGLPFNFMPPNRTFDLSSLPSCAVELPVNGELDLRDEETELRDCRLALTLFEPGHVRLLGARLNNVVIDLVGPVALEFAEDSALALVQIRSDPASPFEGGTSSLLLEDATTNDLIADVGTLQVARAGLRTSRFNVESAQFEASRLRHVTLRTEELEAVATWFADTQLSFEHGRVSASELIATSVVRGCDTLVLAGTTVVESQFGACRGALRLYFDTVERSVLDGMLEIHMTNVSDSVIGLNSPTRLWAWDTTVYGTTFCRAGEQARFEASGLHCAACEGPLSQTDADVCHSPIGGYDARPSPCRAIEAAAECEGDFPERSWPDEVLPPGAADLLADAGLPPPR
jgi:hypothetical protein